jgi:hypothetical protein
MQSFNQFEFRKLGVTIEKSTRRRYMRLSFPAKDFPAVAANGGVA